ncbi:GLPGLI family protein [Chitinophaga sp. HK235]|uniref:GLPGLI family protein n=1 Tax=Chitinophaga sp. HK235 TaxID=2952571 RepID=UPI001BAC037A|nr:GLPGLI family protein [Chitinophaga sp. HK235]
MRYYLRVFVSALFLCFLYSFSYKNTKLPDPPTTLAYYQFYHIKDTTQRWKVWSEDFLLAFNSDKSIYTSQTRVKQDSTIAEKLREAEKNNNDLINMGLILPTTEDDIYVEKGKLAVVKDYDQQSYLIKDASEKTNWIVGKETKQLLGYTAQMATGMVKGRKYTVWFTTDIPASFGPWKLQGLPGLILEAHDDHYFIKFTCTKVVNNGNFQNIKSLDIPANTITTTTAEYERMKKASAQGLGINNSVGTEVAVDRVTAADGGEIKTAPKKKFTINYPLELTQ